MLEKRCLSSDPCKSRKQRPMPKAIPREKLPTLKSDVQVLNGRELAPIVLDTRGNAMSVKSYGHIHHPFNMETSAFRWVKLMEGILAWRSAGKGVAQGYICGGNSKTGDA